MPPSPARSPAAEAAESSDGLVPVTALQRSLVAVRSETAGAADPTDARAAFLSGPPFDAGGAVELANTDRPPRSTTPAVDDPCIRAASPARPEPMGAFCPIETPWFGVVAGGGLLGRTLRVVLDVEPVVLTPISTGAGGGCAGGGGPDAPDGATGCTVAAGGGGDSGVP